MGVAVCTHVGLHSHTCVPVHACMCVHVWAFVLGSRPTVVLGHRHLLISATVGGDEFL